MYVCITKYCYDTTIGTTLSLVKVWSFTKLYSIELDHKLSLGYLQKMGREVSKDHADIDKEGKVENNVDISHKLYASLPLREMLFCILTFTFGVLLAIYSLYMAGQEHIKNLYTLDMVRPWW